MKSRLSGTIWMLTIFEWPGICSPCSGSPLAPGRQSNGASMFESSGAHGLPACIALGMSIVLAWRLGAAFLGPVNELAAFSERLAAGDATARARRSTRTTSSVSSRKI